MTLDRVRRNWNAFGERDPLWAILTWDEMRGGRWDVDAFFATGEAEVAAMLQRARQLHPALRTGRVLDFGCGVGRLSRALAARFAEVHGVDVAPSMIAKARELDAAGAVRWHENHAPDLRRFDAGHFDLVYSSITLQHMPPRLQRGYLREFARVLRDDGLLVFQLPERPARGRSGDPVRRLLGRLTGPLRAGLRRLRSRGPVMDMYGTPRDAVCRWLAQDGCTVLAIDDDTMAGADWRSARYFARRRNDS